MALQATHGQGVELEPSEEMALAAMQIDKQTARQLLNSSLPVPSDVLAGHQKALAQIATKAHQARLHVSALPRPAPASLIVPGLHSHHQAALAVPGM